MNKYKSALSKISRLLDFDYSQSSAFKVALEEIKSVIDYDFGSVFYLNGNSLKLKYQTKEYLKSETPELQQEYKEILLDNKTILYENSNPIIKELNNPDVDGSFLIAKLRIKKTVFGLLVLTKYEKNAFDDEDIEVLEEFCSVISYTIKDFELSDIFNMQLKALQEAVLEKYDAYKTQNDFITNISHELRTPLNSIIGLSESLDSQIFGELNKKQTEYIKDIRTSALHLLTMINDILDISKLESSTMHLNRTLFDLDKSIVEILNIINPLAQNKGIKMFFENSGEIEINADYQKIQQILYNLISNAIKFTPKDGEINIKTKMTTKGIYIIIKDSGIGIEKKDQTKIFEKFVQLKSGYTKNESSTGLGLTITKQLVEMHNGKISVKSEPNKGSEFAVILPLYN